MKQRSARFAACVLILLLFCACANTAEPDAAVSPAPSLPPEDGAILLCGEWHSDRSCISRELALWGDCYAQGVRHLFIESSYFGAEYLNLWMQADGDEILDRLFRELEDTQAYSAETLRFYHTIKEQYPETVFHGVDIGHQNATTGARYLNDLKAAGQEGSEAYALAEEAVEQKTEFDYLASKDPSEADAYRERCMAENFIREYDGLDGERIMGIFGFAHTVTSDRADRLFAPGTATMAMMLEARYGTRVRSTGVIFDPYGGETQTVTVNGKEYAATCLARDDFSDDSETITMEYLRLEDAYADLQDCPATGETYRYTDFPEPVEPDRIYMITAAYADGTMERYFLRTDSEALVEPGYFQYLLMAEIRVGAGE